MSIRIVNWNVEWTRPGTWRGDSVVERIEKELPDVACLTETDEDLLHSGHVVTSQANYGYRAPHGRRKVLLWSRQPWIDIDDLGDAALPTGRFVRATTETSVGQLTFIGVCIPWRDAHVRSGAKNRRAWEDHEAYLVALEMLLRNRAEKSTVVIGDFNQTIPRTRAPQRVFERLESAIAGLTVATDGNIPGATRPTIDHICHSNDLICYEPSVIDNRNCDGRRLSDHYGIATTIELAT